MYDLIMQLFIHDLTYSLALLDSIKVADLLAIKEWLNLVDGIEQFPLEESVEVLVLGNERLQIRVFDVKIRSSCCVVKLLIVDVEIFLADS